MNRRKAMRLMAGASTVAAASQAMAAIGRRTESYPIEAGLETKPKAHQTALEWFKNAKFGLFMHYGLYSQLARGEWVMLRETIPLTKYERLKDTFRPDKFDADHIVSVAIDAGMKYVNLTSKHHEGFCLFRTRQTSYNVTESPTHRDLVDELANACARRGLGMFLYYSAGFDWHHPWFCDPSAGCKDYRPAYAVKPAQYLWRKDSDTRFYIDYVHHQIRELLTQYGPVAGIWFDPIVGYYARPDLFPMEEIYALIHSLQPSCLVSFKQGATGTEDFAAPERKDATVHSYASIAPARRQNAQKVAESAWRKNQHKPLEFCNTLQPRVWGYDRSDDGKHRKAPEVLELYRQARAQNANLLLNTGLLPDGSIYPGDVQTLRSVGKTLSL